MNHILTPPHDDTTSTTTPLLRTLTDFLISDHLLRKADHTLHFFYISTTGTTLATTESTYLEMTWENESYVWHRDLLIMLQHYKKHNHHRLHVDVTYKAFQTTSTLTDDLISTSDTKASR